MKGGERRTMTNRALAEWDALVAEFVTHWTKLGADREIGGMTLVQFQAMAAEVRTAIQLVGALEHDMELAIGDREDKIGVLYAAMQKYIDGVESDEGRSSLQAKTLPKLSKSYAPRTTTSGPTAPAGT